MSAGSYIKPNSREVPPPTSPPASPGRRGGSVLVIVMITLIFATIALVTFIERAGTDLLVESRDVEAKRLRAEAYSALEVTIAVLEDFRQVGNGLHSITEGWGDPLGYASYAPADGRTVEVSFEDESGKLSLPQTNATQLTNLFKQWQLTPAGAGQPTSLPGPPDLPIYDPEELSDALMGWMKATHTYSTAISTDYDRGTLSYGEPGRSMRSFDELGAIAYVRDIFFGADGRPNDLWRRFTSEVSLYKYSKPNLNSPNLDVLAALGQFDDTQRQKFADYLAGTGSFSQQGPEWFTNNNTAVAVVGKGGDPGAFTTTISALRINITVHEGESQFRLVAVVAPPQGATTVTTTASAIKTETSKSSAQNNPTTTQPSSTATASTDPNAASNAKKLNYPFTLLEIKENDEIPPAPPPPPPASA